MTFDSTAMRDGRLRLTLTIERDEVEAVDKDQQTVMRAMMGIHPGDVLDLLRRNVRASKRRKPTP